MLPYRIHPSVVVTQSIYQTHSMEARSLLLRSHNKNPEEIRSLNTNLQSVNSALMVAK